jgi:hypothetical protein
MSRAPRFCVPQFTNICKGCGKPFSAKRTNTEYCYTDECQALKMKHYRERLKLAKTA